MKLRTVMVTSGGECWFAVTLPPPATPFGNRSETDMLVRDTNRQLSISSISAAMR
jgi:hypothetical protein